jgi:transmembrane sensor
VTVNRNFSMRETAALWHERMHRDHVSEETRRAFEAWIQASPGNGAAYSALDETWAALQGALETPPILALRHEAALRLTRRTSRSMRPVRALAAALTLITVGTLALRVVSPSFLPEALTGWVKTWLPGDSHYVTGTGERLSATLRDGSQVTLDTQSELEVAFTKEERRVRLKRGQAFFEVAKDKAHPFVVEVNNRRLVAVGTAFDVRLDEGQIRVTMVEGVVRVEPAKPRSGDSPSAAASFASGSASGNAAPRDVVSHTPSGSSALTRSGSASPRPETLISAGEQLLVDRESEGHVQPADAERATSWRRGQLTFEAVRLGEAIAEVNRYSETKIELADHALADVRISGSFATGRPEVFVEAVTTYFPIEASESTEHVLTLRARR